MSCISAVILVNRADGLNFELASGPRHVGHARGSKKSEVSPLCRSGYHLASGPKLSSIEVVLRADIAAYRKASGMLNR